MQVAVKKMGEIKVWKLLVNFYIIGGLGLIIPFTSELFQQITPLSLLFSFILLLIYHEGDEKTKFFVVSILIAIVGFLVEVLGVQTGIIFGSYQYGETLGPKLFQVPLIIGINWLMLVYCIFIITSRWKFHKWIKIGIGGLLLVLYDLILEPVAIQLNMWSWQGDTIPFQNYLAWYLVSVVMLASFYFSGLDIKNSVAKKLFVVQIVFFLGLNLFFMFKDKLL